MFILICFNAFSAHRDTLCFLAPEDLDCETKSKSKLCLYVKWWAHYE